MARWRTNRAYEIGDNLLQAMVVPSANAVTLVSAGVTVDPRCSEVSFLNVGAAAVYVTSNGVNPTSADYEMPVAGGAVMKVTANVARKLQFLAAAGTVKVDVHQH